MIEHETSSGVTVHRFPSGSVHVSANGWQWSVFTETQWRELVAYGVAQHWIEANAQTESA